MGYLSRLEGEIQIQPPLRWSEIKDSKFRPDFDRDRSIRYRIDEQRIEDDDGERVTRYAIAIEDAWDGDSVKHYGVDSDLQEIAAAHPDHVYTGQLIRYGEENGDVERYRIVSGRVVAEKAALTWPDGTTEPTRL
jgi:hypothetical protein